MDKYGYTIVKQGKHKDGGTWTDYIYTRGGKQREVHIDVMVGLDLNLGIEESVREDVDAHERRETMTKEERDELQRLTDSFRERHPDDDYSTIPLNKWRVI